MKTDGFSKYHPLTNFLFFLGAICLGVVLQHPAYSIAGIVCAGIYYVLLQKRKALKSIATMLPLFFIIALINPIFNTQGEHPLFYLLGRPYTAEALGYGFAVAGILIVTLLWFGCYNYVMTADKFTALFGNFVPALSLLLVMVFRLIPNLLWNATQITDARRAIGKGAESASVREKLSHGMTVLLALTGWALEGSIVTADSMRSRGYGTAKRSSFQIYRLIAADRYLLLAMAITVGLTILGVATGATDVTYTPIFSVAPVSLYLPVYCLYLLIPTFIHVKEVLLCRIFISKI